MAEDQGQDRNVPGRGSGASLHPEECRRIMGFADGFRLHPRQNVYM